MRIRSTTVDTVDSPISSAYALLDTHSSDRTLLDLGQAAPQYPPAPVVREHLAEVVRSAHGGDYTDVPGLPKLREAMAEDLSLAYGGAVRPENVVVTAGCNQAFSLVVSALAGAGDEVVVPLPYYFNHDMWLRLNGIRPVYLEPGADLVPRAAAAEPLITPRTRAIVLVTPGNPTGATVAPEGIAEFAALARRHGIALILDETYRSFRDTDEAAHGLFADPEWGRTVISLHSFSKEFAIPGYRVGAVVASAEFNREVCKLLDCVAVCAPRVGQEAAWIGLTQARAWRRERAQDIARQRAWLRTALADRPGGFELVASGGFFGWLRHPFDGCSTDEVVRRLVVEQDMLLLPGTAFQPEDRNTLRISVSNIDRSAIDDFAGRLRAVGR
ncbi:aminotransferase [Kitasatospora sp. NPDC127059]|uniref:aminotransferase n=1 Tax=unclassified Kitasatospora TaxID=2633591 RepID=UPI0036551C4E